MLSTVAVAVVAVVGVRVDGARAGGARAAEGKEGVRPWVAVAGLKRAVGEGSRWVAGCGQGIDCLSF